jgi:hypothetical protein
MKMKRKHRLLADTLSIVLIVALLTLSASNSYGATIAANEGDVDLADIEAISSSLSESIEDTAVMDVIDQIEYLGFDATGICANDEQNPVITFQKNGDTSVVELENATSETLEMCVSEGEISNEIIINNDGTAYVDGNLIQSSIQSSGSDDTVFMNGFQDRYQLACPYGTASNYSEYARTVKNFNVDFTNMAKNLTLIAFTAVISLEVWYLGTVWGTCYEVAQYFKAYDPFSDAGSFVSKEYVHTKGFFVSSTLAVRKCVLTIYSRHNYEGKGISRIVYYCHQYNY